MEKTIYFLNNYYVVEPFLNPILGFGGVVVLQNLDTPKDTDKMQQLIGYINDVQMPDPDNTESNKDFYKLVTDYIIERCYDL